MERSSCFSTDLQLMATENCAHAITKNYTRGPNGGIRKVNPASHRPDSCQKMPKPNAIGHSIGICSASLIARISWAMDWVLAFISCTIAADATVVV